MDRCKFSEGCPFWNDKLANMPATATLLKKKYCEESPVTCARYRVRTAGLGVPADLFPYDNKRADELLYQPKA